MPDRTDHRLTIRFTREEYAELQAKAGDLPLAHFIRETVLLDAAAKRKAPLRAPIKDHVALARVLATLGTSDLVGAYRDAVRGMADGTIPASEQVEDAMDRIARTLADIRTLLMRALGVAER